MQNYWSHETSIIDAGAEIGQGTKIWHFSHVCGQNTKIGANCSLGQNVYVGPKTKIGEGCRIQNNVSIYDEVELERDVFCGPSMVFTNVVNPRAHVSRKHEFKKTLVKRGATLGANSTIICGIEIGEYAMIGAGAVVSKNVQPYSIMVGVPARHVGWVCQCGVKLPAATDKATQVECATCHSRYKIDQQRCEAIK
jgi:UDP-2-acetamido-3-amino-2,3-dideoxy-glucuronate N-acetyltransferase